MAVHLYGKTCQEEVVNQSQVLTSIIRVSLITDLDYRGDFDSKILFRLLSAFVCRSVSSMTAPLRRLGDLQFTLYCMSYVWVYPWLG